MRLKNLFIFTAAFFLPNFIFGQTFSTQLFQQYEKYKEPSIQERRFKHKDIVPLIKKLKPPFVVEQAGKSMNGKEIYSIKIGEGKTKILLWSQMHGDESTATMAIMDIFNFFSTSDELDEVRKNILDKVTLYFIPMLNPDGADRFRRRTALNVDLNRDALRLQTPEGRLLKEMRDELSADWGFNLHDQSRYYSAGIRNKTATLSFLAPTYNYEKEINPIRKRAMQEIGLMNETLQQFIPNHVAKYNDDFEPRAFGDNIQKWGTSTILIESGGYQDDSEKQFIRKLNFIALMTAFEDIALQKYETTPLEYYESIPFNKRYFHELLIREATIIKKGKPYIIDLAFKRNEIQFNEDQSFYYDSYISDLGDLSTFFGYQEVDAKGYTIIPGKVYPKTLKNWKKFKKLDINQLHQEGYTDVKIKNLNNEQKQLAAPIRLLPANSAFNPAFSLGKNPSFFLEKEGKKKFIIINGNLYALED